MIVVYDFTLIVLSLAVSIIGSHSMLSIMSRKGRFGSLRYTPRIVFGAIVFGGSIWAMHFIGMLAIHLPVPTFYAVLETLASALIAIVLTGLGLYAATSGQIRKGEREVGAALMAAGIVSMHYLGMSGIRPTCIVTSSKTAILSSVVVAFSASWLAIHIMKRRDDRPHRSKLWGAVFLGVAISGMHYVAMAGTSFSLIDNVTLIAEPVLSNYYMASLVLVLAFLLIDVFLFDILPEARAGGFFASSEAATANPAGARHSALARTQTAGEHQESSASMPVPQGPDQDGALDAHDNPSPNQNNDGKSEAPNQTSDVNDRLLIKTIRGGVRFVDNRDLLFVAAEGHYTSLGLMQGPSPEFEAMLSGNSLSHFLKELPEENFCQVHRSYAVNLAHVKEVIRKRDMAQIVFVFDNVPQVPVSRSRLKHVLERLAQGGFLQE